MVVLVNLDVRQARGWKYHATHGELFLAGQGVWPSLSVFSIHGGLCFFAIWGPDIVLKYNGFTPAGPRCRASHGSHSCGHRGGIRYIFLIWFLVWKFRGREEASTAIGQYTSRGEALLHLEAELGRGRLVQFLSTAQRRMVRRMRANSKVRCLCQSRRVTLREWKNTPCALSSSPSGEMWIFPWWIWW